KQEDPSEYCYGGYHPVTIGDTFNGRYRVLRKLGWGYFSTVWLCLDLHKKRVVAVKVSKSGANFTQAAQDELALLRCTCGSMRKHPYGECIVELLDDFRLVGKNGIHMCLVFELLGQNLHSWMMDYTSLGLPLSWVKSIIRQVLQGLDYLHTQCKIIHTDIKPENILLCIGEQCTKQSEEGAVQDKLHEYKRMDRAGTSLKYCNINVVAVNTRKLRFPKPVLNTVGTKQVCFSTVCMCVWEGPAFITFHVGRKYLHKDSSEIEDVRISHPYNVNGSFSMLNGISFLKIRVTIINENKDLACITKIPVSYIWWCPANSMPPLRAHKQNCHCWHLKKGSIDYSFQCALRVPNLVKLQRILNLSPSFFYFHLVFSGVMINGGVLHLLCIPNLRDPLPLPPYSLSCLPPSSPDVDHCDNLQFDPKSVTAEEIKVKIADLGSSCWVYKHFSDEIQTRQYRSLEVLIGSDYGPPADIWSTACMAFELVTGDSLFEPRAGKTYSVEEDHLAHIIELLGKIPARVALSGKYSREYFTYKGDLRRIRVLRPWGIYEVLVEKYHLGLKEAALFADFLLCMLAFSPEQRATAVQCLRHPWLTS
uniref:non-specific serine/threonine protein kinase n=1 Tax=Lepisosteus oculatus TaxID=7918 RepID=W5N879_LEPOC